LLFLFRPAGLPLAVLWALATPAPAQVDGLSARHYSGQTFLTWNELPDPLTHYRVYRAREPFLRESDLDSADLLGRVDSSSSDNHRRSVATGHSFNWIVETGGSQLADDQGLFVHNVRESPIFRTSNFAGRPYPAFRRFHYVVTTVTNGLEDRTLVRGENTATVPFEWAAQPAPVLQNTDLSGELWAHWVGNRATPFQPALHRHASQGFNFRFDPGIAPEPRGLLVRLHSAGQTYAIGWPHRNEVPTDVDILSLSDSDPAAGFTLWLGTHDAFPSSSTGAQVVNLFTIQRVKWTLDWMTDRLGSGHDPERVYAVGGSMGAMGTFYLATEYPDRFAAILCRNGNFDLRAPDINNASFVQSLLGTYSQNLPVAPGLATQNIGIFDRTNASALSQMFPAVDGPVFRTINGRNDTTVGWQSAVTLYEALASIYYPGGHYFDTRRHSPFGHWAGMEQELLKRTLATRRDRPSLHFGGLSINDEAGMGDPGDGDAIGTLNGTIEYDPETAISDPDFCEFEVYLRSEGALDDAPVTDAQVSLTPRRTGPFTLSAGDTVLFTLREGTNLIATHMLTPDGNGLLHTPAIGVTPTRRNARFDRVLGSSQGGYSLAVPRLPHSPGGPVPTASAGH
jgi:pimeloyl-ACP methyl ester carboxylesterase